MIADHKERLRRLALHDDHLVRSMLAVDPAQVEACGLDAKARALVRLGAPVALEDGRRRRPPAGPALRV